MFSNLRFVGAIQEAMHLYPNLWKAIPETDINTEEIDKEDPYFKDFPWEMQIDDDLILEKGHFSKFISKIPNNIFNIPGIIDYIVSGDILHNNQSYFPYAARIQETLKILNKKFSILQTSLITEGNITIYKLNNNQLDFTFS